MGNTKIDIEASYKTLLTLWIAFIMSQFMFLVFIYFSKPEIFDFSSAAPILGKTPVFFILLAILAIAALIASFILKRRFIRQSIDEQSPEFVQSALLVASACCEACCILGLILAFSEDNPYFLAWFAIGIIGIIFHMPRKGDLINASYKGSNL